MWIYDAEISYGDMFAYKYSLVESTQLYKISLYALDALQFLFNGTKMPKHVLA